MKTSVLTCAFSVLVLVAVSATAQQSTAPPTGTAPGQTQQVAPFYVPPYGGYGYGPGYIYPRRELDFAYRQGRRIEKNRQNALESLRRLEAYRRGNRIPRYEASSPPSSGYGAGGSAPYGVYGGDPIESYHRFGRELEYYRQEDLRAREEVTRLVHGDFLARGIEEFREGRYGEAARSFMAAAEKDHGDPASRLHAGQALVAVGIYDGALAYFRRAFELQSRLWNVPLNLQADYGRKADYDSHVAKLKEHCGGNPKDGSAWFLLAIEQFFGPDPAAAAQALAHARKLMPKDYLVQQFVRNAEPLLRQGQVAKTAKEKT